MSSAAESDLKNPQPAPDVEFREKPHMAAFWQMSREELKACLNPRPVVGAHVPNPRRQAAGRLNRQKRKGLTQAGRQKLRESAIKNQPWRHSTGPRTLAGKERSAYNGRYRQDGEVSVRKAKAELRESLTCGDKVRAMLEMLSLD